MEHLKAKARNMWRVNCQQITDYDAECVAKDAEIATLPAKIEELEARGGKDMHTSPHKPADAPAAAGGGGPADAPSKKAAAGGGETADAPSKKAATGRGGPADAPLKKAAAGGGGTPTVSATPRKGKAPPVDAYKGGDVDMRLND